MDIALVENNDFLSFLVYEHDWIHILYIGVTATFFLIQLCQRISLDLLYSSSNYSKTVSLSKLFSLVFFCLKIKTKDEKSASIVPSLNRYPTDLTPSAFSMSCIWYFVYTWQVICQLILSYTKRKKPKLFVFFLCV